MSNTQRTTSRGRSSMGLSRPQIAKHLNKIRDDGFISGWERHVNCRYWRVRFDQAGVAPRYTAWYSQTQIAAWIDGAHSMGAAYP